MSFQDIILLVLVMFVMIIVVNIAEWINQNYIVAGFNESNIANSSIYNNTQIGMQNTEQFFDYSFTAIFLVVGIGAVLLTAYLAPHPAILAVWVLINCLTLFIYDQLTDYLTTYFQGSIFDMGVMANAIAFWLTGLPKVIVALNILMAVLLFGKRVLQ